MADTASRPPYIHKAMLLWENGDWTGPAQIIFEWDMAHTVNVYKGGRKLDSFRVGDPAKKTTSSTHVARMVRVWLDSHR